MFVKDKEIYNPFLDLYYAVLHRVIWRVFIAWKSIILQWQKLGNLMNTQPAQFIGSAENLTFMMTGNGLITRVWLLMVNVHFLLSCLP